MKKNLNITPIITVLGLIWLMFALNFLTAGKLNHFLALEPRQLSGLFGILTHPFAHADVMHLISNSFPFFILSLFVGYSCGMKHLWGVWLVGAIGSGVGIWLFSSAAVVGASGVVFFLNGFLLARCYTHPSLNTIVIAVVVLFFYAGALWSLFDFNAPGISWVGHLSGFVTGIGYAFLTRFENVRR
ncbi:MAG: rhomboid family intramembrane serine protease [Gammaproteobacteria bacterium]|nr:MAG: rhomboid family intramembrane serine protease [Gammaproteobacteria bacterium]